MRLGLSIFCILAFFSSSLNANNVLQEQLPPFKKEYKVVLMLPFCIGMPDKWKVRDIMAEYYEGVEMAIADLESQGLKMKLTVLDTKMDSLEVIRLLQNPELQEIGPTAPAGSAEQPEPMRSEAGWRCSGWCPRPLSVG